MAFKPKEARPHSGPHVNSGGASREVNYNKSAGPHKTFSKPSGGGGAGRPGVAGAGAASRHSSSSSSSIGQKPNNHQKNERPRIASSAVGDTPPASTAADMFAADESGSKPAKTKKPKPPKIPLDPNGMAQRKAVGYTFSAFYIICIEHISQRAFIGGLAKDVTPTDVEGRFKSFGQLKDVYLAKDTDGTCRGFGYVTLDTTRKDWQKCVALFNGAKWKGNVLKIEEANKDWQTRRQEDLEAQKKLEKKEQDAALKKLKRNPVKYAEDMSLITDKNMDGKRGWKRGRFGRPVITMKLDRMTYDPSHYKNNVEKLFNLSGKPLPLNQLVYHIDEDEPKPKGKHLPSEVALAPFLNSSKPTAAPSTSSSSSTTATIKPSTADPKKDHTRATPASSSTEPKQHDNISTSDDRAMMASILAGIDMSPRALSLDGSDFDDDEEGNGGSYMEDFGSLKDTQADDLFGDVELDAPSTLLSKAERDSRPEDLFGDDEDEKSHADQSSLDFLEEDDEEMESADEEVNEEGAQSDEEEEEEEEEDGIEEEEDSDDDDNDSMDEDTIRAIAQLQGSSSSVGGGLFDSDDEAMADAQGAQNIESDDEDDVQDTKSAMDAQLAEESNVARLKALAAREAELEAAREKQQQLIASTLANIDSRDKKEGHVVFSDSDDYDSEDYEQMEADHARKLAQANKPLKSIFDSDSGSEPEEELSVKDKRTKKPKSGVKEMFASDDEDNDNTLGKFEEPALNIKEQFEGPGGKALFKMQTKIGTTDSRFQLTKDFLDDRIRAEDDADFVAHQDRIKGDELAASGGDGIVLDEDRQAEADVSAEKMQALNVLRAMFGDSAVRSKKKEEDSARQAKGGLGYTTGLTVRYDPDAAPPPLPLIVQAEVAAKDTEKSVSDSDTNEDETIEQPSGDEDDMTLQDDHKDETAEEKKATETRPVKKSVGFSFAFDSEALNQDEKDVNDDNESSNSSVPSAKKDQPISTQFQVAGDLKSLFAPAAGGFKLFGGDDDDDDDNMDGSADVEDDRQNEDRSQDEILTSYTDGSRTIFASGADALTSTGRAPLSHSGSMFFFHFTNPTLLKRSNFKTNNKMFMRTSSIDEITAQWEKTRHTMTQEFKRKHKSASRNKARASKRLKSGPSGDQS
ncbi:nucleolar protein 8 [Mortierella claussenii]|nr:nucleolar protein 8 [Mortierella claussenii]